MALSPLVEKMLAQMVQQQGPMLSPLAPVGQMALAAALASREKRSRKEDEQKVAGLAETLAAIQSPDASQFAPQGVMGSTGSQNGIAPMDVPIVTQTPEDQAGGARSRLADAYTKMAAGNPEALQTVLMNQMFPDQGKPQVVAPGAAVVQNGREVFRNPAATPGPMSPRGRLFADYQSGAFGDPNSPEAKEQLRLGLEADAGRGTTTINNLLPNGNTPATSANETAFQQKIMTGRDRLATLRTAGANFNPMFLTYKGKLDMGLLKVKDMAQGLPFVESLAGGPLNNEQKKLLGQYTAWQQSSFQTLNETIKELTGAAMSETEAVRLRKQMPDPENDSATQYVTKFNATTRQLQLAEARYQMALREGIPLAGASDLERFMSLDDVQSQINQAGETLYKQFQAQGFDDSTAKQKALQEVSARFGVAL